MRITLSVDGLNSFPMQNRDFLVATDYYEEPAGQSEYRLYSYLSFLFDDILILDIGTLEGRSAIALSHNDSNRVISYNVVNQIPASAHKTRSKHNVVFRVGNVLDDLTADMVREARIVVIDIDHYGNTEMQILQRLSELGFSGLVLLDDLFRHPDAQMNACMAQLWKDVDSLPNTRKYDVSTYGHWTGTGLLVMNAPDIVLNLK